MLQLPVMVIAVLVALCVIGVRVWIDTKEVMATRRIRRLTNEYVTKHNTPRITVVIELRRTAETIMPLLDHLYGHHYAGLEVIVVIMHTAGNHAQPKLLYYRRKYQRKGLKIVRHAKGMTTDVVLRRYASGKLVMLLMPEDRLLDGFFTDTVLEFLDEDIDVVQPRRHIAVGKTLASAVMVVRAVWRHMVMTLQPSVTVASRLVYRHIYRRRALGRMQELRCRYSSRTVIQTPSATRWAALRYDITSRGRVWWMLVAAFAVIVGLVAVFWGQDMFMIAQLLVLGYCVLYVLTQIGLRAYSLLQQVSLLLFAPFSWIFILLLSVRSVFATATRPKLGRRDR